MLNIWVRFLDNSTKPNRYFLNIYLLRYRNLNRLKVEINLQKNFNYKLDKNKLQIQILKLNKILWNRSINFEIYMYLGIFFDVFLYD